MQDGQAEFLPLDYKAMRRNRGECLLASCAAIGCMMVIVVVALAALWYCLRPSPSNVRPMVHQTPARSVEIQSGGSRSVQVSAPVTSSPAPAEPVHTPVALPTPTLTTPLVEETPLPQDFGATISADGYMPGMAKGVVQPSKRLIFKGNSLVEVREAKTLQVDEREWKVGDRVDLAQLRSLLPTRRESQKTERDGAIRHSFPQASGVDVQIWVLKGRAQKFALIRQP